MCLPTYRRTAPGWLRTASNSRGSARAAASTVALVRGLRFSSTWLTRRSRAASRLPLGLRTGRDHLDEVVPLFVTGSTPAYTRTRRAPLGRRSMLPRSRFRGFTAFDMAANCTVCVTSCVTGGH